jgi:hypothetical protein
VADYWWLIDTEVVKCQQFRPMLAEIETHERLRVFQADDSGTQTLSPLNRP